jgi:hypothetical protein
MSSSPRVLVASRRSIQPHVSWSSAYEFEDTVAAIDDVDLCVPETIEVSSSGLVQDALSRVWDATGVTIQRRQRRRKVRLDGDYDLFFARIMTPYFFDHIDAIEGWREKCRIKVCWMEEVWQSMLEYEEWYKVLRDFDYIFVGRVDAAPTLSKIIDRPCTYLSFGVDALRFCPYPDSPTRSIDFYAMGRRSPVMHEALLDHARSHPNFMYLYDSVLKGNFSNGPEQHRELTANITKRTRYFLADRAKVDEPSVIRGDQVFGPRFFEGAAGGAILIGEPPDCPVFREDFDWPDAVVPLRYGSSAILDLLAELDADPMRTERARRANVIHSLRRHDWLYRWQTILDTVGLEPTSAFSDRLDNLRRRADAVEAEALG